MRFALALLLLGCVIPQGPDPCDLDPTSCRRGESFTLDPECTLTGDLVVQAGEGYERFETVGDGLDVQEGFQGGRHFFGAVRVENAALDRYDQLEAHFSLTRPDEEEAYTERTVVLGDFEPIEQDAEGRVVAYGYIVRVDEGSSSGDLYEVSVRDPCGRTGSDTITLP